MRVYPHVPGWMVQANIIFVCVRLGGLDLDEDIVLIGTDTKPMPV